MAKLTKEEIEKLVAEEEETAIHRMYTDVGCRLWVKAARLFYNHYSEAMRVLILPVLFGVDIIDTMCLLVKTIRKK